MNTSHKEALKDSVIVVDGLTVHYRTAGNPDNQALVFFNGWAATIGFSEPVIRELSKHFYVISPELPGFMRTEPPKQVWTHGDFVRFICALLNDMGVSSPVLMGQSFGGGIAAACALAWGKKVQHVVLVDADLGGRKENWYSRLKYVIPFITKSIRYLPFQLERMLWSAYLGVPVNRINRDNVRSYIVMAEFQASPDYLPTLDYSMLKAPLLLVWGNRDTWVTDIQGAREVQQEVAGSQLVIVNGPHTILYRKPHYVIDRIVQVVLP